MTALKNSFDYFQHHAICVTEDRFNLMTVKRHPRGGWTIAEQSPHSTVSTYTGGFSTEKAAQAHLSGMRIAAVQEYMKECIAAGHRPSAPAEASPQQELDL